MAKFSRKKVSCKTIRPSPVITTLQSSNQQALACCVLVQLKRGRRVETQECVDNHHGCSYSYRVKACSVAKTLGQVTIALTLYTFSYDACASYCTGHELCSYKHDWQRRAPCLQVVLMVLLAMLLNWIGCGYSSSLQAMYGSDSWLCQRLMELLNLCLYVALTLRATLKVASMYPLMSHKVRSSSPDNLCLCPV